MGQVEPTQNRSMQLSTLIRVLYPQVENPEVKGVAKICRFSANCVSSLGETALQAFEREIRILKELSAGSFSANSFSEFNEHMKDLLQRFHGVAPKVLDSGVEDCGSHSVVFFITEAGGVNLQQFLSDPPADLVSRSSSLVRQIAFDVAVAVCVLHGLGYVHLDLSCEQFVQFKGPGQNRHTWKLVDVGSVVPICDKNGRSLVWKDVQGWNTWTAAPNIAKYIHLDNILGGHRRGPSAEDHDDKPITQAPDLWALGTILGELGSVRIAERGVLDELTKVACFPWGAFRRSHHDEDGTGAKFLGWRCSSLCNTTSIVQDALRSVEDCELRNLIAALMNQGDVKIQWPAIMYHDFFKSIELTTRGLKRGARPRIARAEAGVSTRGTTGPSVPGLITVGDYLCAFVCSLSLECTRGATQKHDQQRQSLGAHEHSYHTSAAESLERTRGYVTSATGSGSHSEPANTATALDRPSPYNAQQHKRVFIQFVQFGLLVLGGSLRGLPSIGSLGAALFLRP